MRAPEPSAEYLAAREANHKKPETRSYRVVSEKGVFGYEQGDIAELTLTEGEETALMEAGHIVPAGVPAPAYRAIEPAVIEDSTGDDESSENSL